jgi:hypothetical protein
MSSSLPLVIHGLFQQTGTMPTIPLKLLAAEAGQEVTTKMVLVGVAHILN